MKCKIGQILTEATGAENLALAQALEDHTVWSAKKLSAAINKTRFSVGATTIKEHRRTECACYR